MKVDPPHIKLAERLFHNGNGLHSSIAESHMGPEHWEKLGKDVGVENPGQHMQYQAISHLKRLEDAKEVLGDLPNEKPE